MRASGTRLSRLLRLLLLRHLVPASVVEGLKVLSIAPLMAAHMHASTFPKERWWPISQPVIWEVGKQFPLLSLQKSSMRNVLSARPFTKRECLASAISRPQPWLPLRQQQL
jgi:hypothetical protein